MVVNEQATKIAASAERIWKLFATHEGQRIAGKGYVSSMEFEGNGQSEGGTLQSR